MLVFQEKFPSVKTSRLQLFKTCQREREREREREMSEFDSGDRQQQQRRKTAQLHADSLIPACQTRSHQAQPEPCEAQTQACALDIALNVIEASREMTWYRIASAASRKHLTGESLAENFTSFSTSFYTQNMGCSDTDIWTIIINDYYVSLWPIVMDKMADIIIISINAFSRSFYPKQYIQATLFCQYVCFLGIEPTTFCAANAMLYHWATET